MGKPAIKAIETKFDGHRFRSRLEARWAVFLKDLEIEYEYELEGYKLPSGKCYLPDFYLPTMDCFVEVKPIIDFDFNDFLKMVEFSHQSDRNLLVICGTPSNETMFLINRFTICPIEEILDRNEDSTPPQGTTKYWIYQDPDAVIKFGLSPLTGNRWSLRYIGSPVFREWKIDKAIDRAKAARFEHGEKP